MTDKNEFYSSLSGKGIRDKKYPHFCKVWKKLERKIKTDYHDLYLICDVSLLVDIFEKLRNRCLQNYDLCPTHYLSPPALSWEAMLSILKLS